MAPVSCYESFDCFLIVCFSRIVNENKVELNGIEVTSTHDHLTQTDALNSSSFLPPVPVNSPTTSSTGGSWFSSLSNVVDSPSSYPNWSNQEISGEASTEKRASAEECDSLERPRKMLRLDDGCGTETGGDADGASDAAQPTEAGGEEQKSMAPLLTQLLSNSNAMEQAETAEEQAETSHTEEATGLEESVRANETIEPIETSSSEPVSATVKPAHAAENSAEDPAAGGDACDSTMTSNNFLADDDSNPGESQFSESDGQHCLFFQPISYKQFLLIICNSEPEI